jgi:hypothetical protein
VRPDVYEKYRRVIRMSKTLVIDGRLQMEQGTTDVLAQDVHGFDDGGIVEGIKAHNFH